MDHSISFRMPYLVYRASCLTLGLCLYLSGLSTKLHLESPLKNYFVISFIWYLHEN